MIIIIMFITLLAVLVGIAGLQYLALCEQRRTRWQLARIEAAVQRFEFRRPIYQAAEETFTFDDVFSAAWDNYERLAA